MTIQINVGDIIQARVYTHINNQLGLIVLHYQVPAVTPPAPTDLDAATAIDGNFAGAVKGLMSQFAEYAGSAAQIIYPIRRPAQFSVASKGFGTALGDPLPTQVAGIITKRTSVGTRRGLGRCYVPFPSEGDNDSDGSPTLGYLTRLAGLASIVASDLSVPDITMTGDATLRPILWNHATQQAVVVDETVSRDKWGTQRRRGDYGQRNILPF